MNKIEGVASFFWHKEIGVPKRPMGRLWYFAILLFLWTVFSCVVLCIHEVVKDSSFAMKLVVIVLLGILVFIKRRWYSPRSEGNLHRSASFHLPNRIFLGWAALAYWYRTIRVLAHPDRTMVFVVRGHITEGELRIYEVPEREFGISSLPFVGFADHNVFDENDEWITGEWPCSVWLPAINFTFSRRFGPMGVSSPWGIPEPLWRSCLFQGGCQVPGGTKLTILHITTRAWGDAGREGCITHVEVQGEGIGGVGQRLRKVDGHMLAGFDVESSPEALQCVPKVLRAREVLVKQRGRTFTSQSSTMHWR